MSTRLRTHQQLAIGTDDDLSSQFAGDPLFEESWPYACLTLRSVVDMIGLRRAVKKYELAVLASRLGDTIHVHTVVRREAEHKRQAVRLFVAAVELVNGGLVAALHLDEISRLHEHMCRAIGRDPSPHTPDGRIVALPLTPGVLSLGIATALHLRQAGFVLPEGLSPRLHRNEVAQIYHTLAGSKTCLVAIQRRTEIPTKLTGEVACIGS